MRHLDDRWYIPLIAGRELYMLILALCIDPLTYGRKLRLCQDDKLRWSVKAFGVIHLLSTQPQPNRVRDAQGGCLSSQHEVPKRSVACSSPTPPFDKIRVTAAT